MRLELHEPEGALDRLEAWLHERGFFAPGGESLCADLYLGYGLSQAIRRDGTPPPSEPCRLPVLACSVHSGPEPDRQPGDGSLAAGLAEEPLRIGAWQRTWSEQEYRTAIDAVRSAIGRGDVYQVNLVQHLSAPFSGSPYALAARLRSLPQPRDWPLGDEAWRVLSGGDAETGGWAIVSASPELFLARRGSRVWTMPIKGTRPAGAAAELRRSAKDAAEHVMIVDLERNDLSRVCLPGSVRWPQLMAARSLAGVEHMVSLVEGRLRPGVGLAQLLSATFPGGSVTGAPKIAAVDVIAALEPVGRGASMGAMGRVHGNGDLELALTIRTFAVADDTIHLWVGGGVVWDSDPSAEVAESLTKAVPLLRAIGAPLPTLAGRVDERPAGRAARRAYSAAAVRRQPVGEVGS